MTMPIKPSFLIDINGVLYADHKPILGAAKMLDLLREKGYSFRLVSNATQACRKTLHEILLGYGLHVREEEIFSAPVATAQYIKRTDKSCGGCFLLTIGDVYTDFLNEGIKLVEKNPAYVAIGDAGAEYTFERMNKAFNMLLDGAGFVTMEKDRYWKSPKGLSLCAGAYTTALEYASGRKATLIGKPSRRFFGLALKDMKAKPKDTVMIGDDLLTDVQGAQKMGMKAYFVKTGKHNMQDVKKFGIKPDKILDSIADLSFDDRK